MDIRTTGSSIPTGDNIPRGSISGPSSRPRLHARGKPSTEPADALRQLQKQLTKYAHQTSSQFALIICDQKGNMQLPIPATSAFQGYLDNWIPENVRSQARQIAISAAKEKKVRRRRDSGIARDSKQQQQHQQRHRGNDDDDELDWDEQKELSPGERMMVQNSPIDGDVDSHMKKRPSQDDTISARKKKSVPRPEPVRRASSAGTEDVSSELEFQPLIIGDEDAVTTFYMTRLRQMQQLMCKVVAKAWIKVIEPKKQTNYPYNRGNESKPSWWPEDVRHKEPDHLMKPERLQLLLTMLRCRKVPIAKLSMATQEVMVQIPKERVPLLEEIYMVAIKEESCREGALSPETAVYVASSAEKIIASKAASAKERSPETRRQSIASPPHSGPGSTVAITDRRMSMQSPTHSDLAGDGRGSMDIRDLSSRVGSRDDSGGVAGLQPTHNPFSGNSAPAANLNTTIEYTSGFVAHTSPLQGSPMQEQQSFLTTEPLNMRAFYSMEQPPIMRKNYTTMPTLSQQSAHSWSNTQMGIYPTYSPGATPSHTPYSRQSASNPATPVGNGSFQGLQLPPPHQNREQPPAHYEQTQHMTGGHQNITSGYTEFLRSDLATEDGGRGVKMD